jgi:hypothetical protein
MGSNQPVNSSANDLFQIDSYVSGSTSTASSQRVLAPNFAQHLSTRPKKDDNFLTKQPKISSNIECELNRLNIELDKHRLREIELYNDNEKFQKLVEHYKRANQVRNNY